MLLLAEGRAAAVGDAMRKHCHSPESSRRDFLKNAAGDAATSFSAPSLTTSELVLAWLRILLRLDVGPQLKQVS
jgi:hypothetical protein